MTTKILNILPKPAENSKLKARVNNSFSQNKQKEQEGFTDREVGFFVDSPKFASFTQDAQGTNDVFMKPCAANKSCNCSNKCGCAKASANYVSLSAIMPGESQPKMHGIPTAGEKEEGKSATPMPITTQLYVGSITIVGLFIAYRMIRKTM
jgi:hypothetical protein